MYHEKTLELLDLMGLPLQRNISLEKYADLNNIVIPASFREWSELDTNYILEKYSNGDPAYLTTPEIVNLKDGSKGLLFQQENQGNFDKIVMLEQGDDPPVKFAWIGQEPWVEYSKTFSDCVYAQIFDWQYMLEFAPDDTAEITYYGTLDLKDSSCLAYLKNNFSETVKTNCIIDDDRFEEYRFFKSAKERIRVIVENEDTTSICLTGEYPLIRQLEDELRQQFSDQLISSTSHE